MDELHALLEGADAADAVLKKYFRQPFAIRTKADGSFVTPADQESEKAVLGVLQKHFPEYGFLAEESGQVGDQNHRWVIDPLDGTHSFIRGLPFFGPLLAYEENGVVQAGVVSLPMLGERVFASKGNGCFWNGKKCRVSDVATLENAYLNCELTRSAREGYGESLAQLAQTVHQERGYADVYGYFAVATGQADVFIEGYPHAWDVAAPTICIEEAGGHVSKLPGRKNGLSVASNGALHPSVCDVLEKYRQK